MLRSHCTLAKIWDCQAFCDDFFVATLVLFHIAQGNTLYANVQADATERTTRAACSLDMHLNTWQKKLESTPKWKSGGYE